jgi:thiol reductant ABC exporter CydC subunit
MSARTTSRIGWAVGLARPQWPRIGAGVLLGALAVLAAMALLATSGYLISKAALQPPILTLTIAIVGVRFFGILRALSRYLERLVSHDAALRTLARVRTLLYERLVPQVPGGLGLRSGDVLSRFVGDVEALQHLFVRALGPPLIAVVAIAVAVGMAWALSPAAGAVMAGALLLSAVALPVISGLAGRRSGRRQAVARSQLTSEFLETLEGAPELALYGREDQRIARLARADGHLVDIARRDAWLSGATGGLSVLATVATMALVVAAAVPGVASGQTDGVLLAALALLALGAFEAIVPLPVAAQHMSATASAAGRLQELTERPAPFPDPRNPQPVPGTGPLALRDAVVRFDGDPVLSGASLTIYPGERVALVGPSGAGKSTVALALTRLVPLESGRALVGGVDLRDLEGEAVRQRVRLERGDGHIFGGSIRENVRLSRPDANDVEVDRALVRAGAGTWIASLPDGADSSAGEDGALVSGGQRQRILLARALLADARFLILDEPSAHLDDDAADALLADLVDAVDEERGVLLITHRMDGLESFDRVVVLEEGRVVESGPVQELRSARGRFSELEASQR